MQLTRKITGVALVALAALCLSLGVSTANVAASTTPQAGGQVLTIPAGQTAKLRVRGLCIDFGLPFPGTSKAPTELAQDQMRAALNYAVNKGYLDNDADARQTEQAMWFLSDGTWHRADHVRAQEIVDAGKDAANKPADPTSGTSLLDALKAKNVTVTVSLTPPAGTSAENAFYGDGDLSVTNAGTQEIQVFMPFGVVFPADKAGDQRLIGYGLVTQPAPTLTAGPTNTAAATSTVAATATEVVAAVATTAPTEVAPAVATTAPEMMATPTGGVSLPSTGAETNGLPSWLLLIGTGLVALLAGFGLLRRNANSL